MNTLQQIKFWAECGWTQADCAQALDLSYEKFRTWLRLQPGFSWPKIRTIGQRSAVRDHGTEACLKQLANMRQSRVDALPRYTVRGVTGTYQELAREFAEVSPVTVWRRLSRGWGIERALFTPCQKRPSSRLASGSTDYFGRYSGQ